jgi:phosphatidate cytidylyltransferase
MSNLVARLLTAGLLIPFLILAISWQQPYGVFGVVWLATAIGLREWMNMTLASGAEGPPAPAVDRYFGVVMGAAWAGLMVWFGERPMVVPAALAALTITTFLFYLFRYQEIETVARRMAFTVAGYLYVGLLAFLALIKTQPHGAAWIYVALTIAWLSDTGAYFAGRFIGPLWPRKLYESVSPKKTVIGSIGGLAASVGALVLAKLWYLPSLSWIDCVAIAVPANILGQLGDLAESLIKRSVGVKDSGALLPGHGGMLDRVDALLFVAPYVYCYARWVFGRF